MYSYSKPEAQHRIYQFMHKHGIYYEGMRGAHLSLTWAKTPKCLMDTDTKVRRRHRLTQKIPSALRGASLLSGLQTRFLHEPFIKSVVFIATFYMIFYRSTITSNLNTTYSSYKKQATNTMPLAPFTSASTCPAAERGNQHGSY